MTLASADRRLGLFVALALLVNVVDAAAVHAAAGSTRAPWVAAGAVVDLLGVVGLLYYLLLVRPGLRGWPSLGVVMSAAALRATMLVAPPAGVGILLAGVCELSLVACVIAALRRPAGACVADRAVDRDPVARIGEAVTRVMPAPGMARLVTAELSVLYYALGTWRTPPDVPPGAQAFSLERRAGLGGLLGVLVGVSLVEMAIAHLLLSHWRPTIAWVVTALGAYGLLYLVGFVRAIRLRPVLLDDTTLDVRYGLAFRLRVPLARIARVCVAGPSAPVADVTLPRRRPPALVIELDEPLLAERLLGRLAPARVLALSVDDDAAFARALGLARPDAHRPSPTP